MEHRLYHLYGQVQGVGLRYRASHLAQMYRLRGYVSNEYDGSVLLELQGDSSAMEHMLQNLKEARFIEIESEDYVKLPLDDSIYGFHIID